MKKTIPALTANAQLVLEKRYLWKNDDGSFAESPTELFERVASSVAEVERRERTLWSERFYQLMATRRFLPNSPTLMNAGRQKGQLSACFVLPVEDSLDSLFQTLKNAAKIHQSGGGTGFSFSRIRPHGSVVKTSHGVASGPLSFIKIYDVATETIKQGGTRRGANMAILRVDHPDIFDFIDSKRDQQSIANFNISVGITDEFMEALEGYGDFALRDPRTKRVVKEVKAREIFDRIVLAAWECGDPGLVFLDRINTFQPTPKVGEIESTNPCVTGETRVLVEGKGFVQIRDLVGQKPAISTSADGPAVFNKSTGVFCTGIKPVFRLKTYEGFELRLTVDHRVMTERGDVPASELEPGDRLHLIEREAPEVSKDSRDARLGEVIGWIVGDGHFTIHEAGKPTVVLSFYGEDKQEAAVRLAETVRELIGDDRLSLNGVESRDMVYLRSQRLRSFLAETGVTESAKKFLPEIVWRGSDDLVCGFLRGLFSADGSIQESVEKGVSARLASNQLGLLKDVQLILLRLGIEAVLYKNRRKAQRRLMPDSKGNLREYDCEAQHELVISKSALPVFSRTVGFLINKKQETLLRLLADYRRGPYRAAFRATVEEILPVGEEEVFDLTEPQTSHFHANGILVHNCGEQPLLPYESCNLGSLNLGEYFRAGSAQIDWKLLREDVWIATRFLDDVIDLNHYPVSESAKITLRNRKIGLGVMGFADLLLLMGIGYDSPKALEIGEKVMSFIDREAKNASADLARARGAFPNWKGSLWERLGYPPMRNATVSTVAPTGTISIIAGASSGIEPIFSGVFYRNVLAGERLVEIHPAVQRVLESQNSKLDELSDEKIAQALGEVWKPASVISVDDHIRIQAAFQRHSDSAVSKTINLPESAKPEAIGHAYRLAYRLGCKGITVYRDRSRPTQVLEKATTVVPNGHSKADSCPSC